MTLISKSYLKGVPFLSEASPIDKTKRKYQEIFGAFCLGIDRKDPGIRYCQYFQKLALTQIEMKAILPLATTSHTTELNQLSEIAVLASGSPSVPISFFKYISSYYDEYEKSGFIDKPLPFFEGVLDQRKIREIVSAHAYGLLLLKKLDCNSFVFKPLFYFFFERLETLNYQYLILLDNALKPDSDRDALFMRAIVQTYIKEKKADFFTDPFCRPIVELISSLKKGTYEESDFKFNTYEKIYLSLLAKPEYIRSQVKLLRPENLEEALSYLDLNGALRFLGICYFLQNPSRSGMMCRLDFVFDWEEAWIEELFFITISKQGYSFLKSLLKAMQLSNRQNDCLTTAFSENFSLKQIPDELLLEYLTPEYLSVASVACIKKVFKNAVIYQRPLIQEHILRYVELSPSFLEDELEEAAKCEEFEYFKLLLAYYQNYFDGKAIVVSLIQSLDKGHLCSLELKKYYPSFIENLSQLKELNFWGLYRYQACYNIDYLESYLIRLLDLNMMDLYDHIFHSSYHSLPGESGVSIGLKLIQSHDLARFYALYNLKKEWGVDELILFMEEIVKINGCIHLDFFLHPCIASLPDENIARFLVGIFKKYGVQYLFYFKLLKYLPLSDEQYRACFEYLKRSKNYSPLFIFKFCSVITQDDWDALLIAMIQENNIKELKCYRDHSYPKLSLKGYDEGKGACAGNLQLLDLVQQMTIGYLYVKSGTRSEFSSYTAKLHPELPLFDPKFSLKTKLKSKVDLLRTAGAGTA